MKISALNNDLVTAVYDHEGEKLTLKIDRNIITPGFLRRVAELRGDEEKNRNGNGHAPEKEGSIWLENADALEKNAKVSAAMLSSDLIREWDLTEDDGLTPIPIVEESFARLPPVLVTRLFGFALEQAQTVKKTITATTGDGSQEIAENAPPS